jgi:hypothetical protein
MNMKTVLRLAMLMVGISIAGATCNFLGQEPPQQVKLYGYSGILRPIDTAIFRNQGIITNEHTRAT